MLVYKLRQPENKAETAVCNTLTNCEHVTVLFHFASRSCSSGLKLVLLAINFSPGQWSVKIALTCR